MLCVPSNAHHCQAVLLPVSSIILISEFAIPGFLAAHHLDINSMLIAYILQGKNWLMLGRMTKLQY